MAGKEHTLETLLPSEGASDFQIQLAGLSDAAQQQAKEVVEAAAIDGTLDDLDLDQVINDARDADSARERAEDLEIERAQAAGEGDYERAVELSQKAEYDLREVAEKGDKPVEAFEAIRDAEYAQMDLETADYHQDIAAGNLDAAIASEAAGEFETAEVLYDAAGAHIEAAHDYGNDTDAVADAEQQDADDALVE